MVAEQLSHGGIEELSYRTQRNLKHQLWQESLVSFMKCYGQTLSCGATG